MTCKHCLTITVHKIKGTCPVYKEGDQFFIKDGFILDSRKSCDVCVHSLTSILPYYVALAHGVAPAEIGLTGGDGETAFVQCLDPCEITGGGTVTLKIERNDETG